MAIPAKLSGKSIKRLTFSTTGAGTIPVFTVTGTVEVSVVAVCLVNIVGAGNIELGIAAATGALIPITVAVNCAAGEIWHDAAPDAEIELTTVIAESIISDGNDIGLLSSAVLTSGSIEFYCNWAPLSADGLVVPA